MEGSAIHPTSGLPGCPLCNGAGCVVKSNGTGGICAICYDDPKMAHDQCDYFEYLELLGGNGRGNFYSTLCSLPQFNELFYSN